MSNTKLKNPLILSEQMCFSLYTTSRAITKKYAELLAHLNVTYPQYLTLLALWENDGMTVNELAQALEIEGATMTPLVQRMEKLGLVVRKRNSDDERRVNVVLTERGASLRGKAVSIPPAFGCAIGVSDVEAQAMITELKKIRDRLK
ncbi:MarR family transcriptional regulator [uncultured Tateyamaria sp.]|uniref:MarR family winged helix-turn-helix transcriptional regulator n=1 Tax=uncultured Tateyamaria sp. TaxID=455651 RepID=UPI002624D1C8|nr:MarR family transcriptional regulator [uncultured Tateyamaria sp.]